MLSNKCIKLIVSIHNDKGLGFSDNP